MTIGIFKEWLVKYFFVHKIVLKPDVTILTEVVIGILDLWNASTYLSISQKI
jgi:hypothetical protein